ncbi:hypothetical protein KXV57_004292, partial [Aspergillus fumigatus]
MSTPSDLGLSSATTFPYSVAVAVQNHLKDHGKDRQSFFVGNLDSVLDRLEEWRRELPFVQPFYAVKCNDNKTLLTLLSRAGTGFDCASKKEMQQILQLGVNPERIIFAAPRKAEDHINYAHEHGIDKIVVDSEDELRKLAEIVPSAMIFLRLRADDPTSRVRLSEKFGSDLLEARGILQVAVDLSVKVTGICFHVGSAALDPGAYVRAIAMAREVYDYNETLSSKHPISIIDIGGGFTESNFRLLAPAVRSAADMYFGGETGIQWVAEPGRFIVSEAFYLVCRVLGTRKRLVEYVDGPNQNHYFHAELFVNDGIYQNFLNALVEGYIPTPVPLDPSGRPYGLPEREDKSYSYTVWGQTCCGADKIKSNCRLRCEMQAGDLLCFPSMGAYTHVTASGFNGFTARAMTVWTSSVRGREKLKEANRVGSWWNPLSHGESELL